MSQYLNRNQAKTKSYFKGLREMNEEKRISTEKPQDDTGEPESTWLERARWTAQRLSRGRGSVSVDQVRRVMKSHNDMPDSPGGWTHIFVGNRWEAIGFRRYNSETTRSRKVTIWRYKI
jgi:hypothetical protein